MRALGLKTILLTTRGVVEQLPKGAEKGGCHFYRETVGGSCPSNLRLLEKCKPTGLRMVQGTAAVTACAM